MKVLSLIPVTTSLGFPGGSDSKASACKAGMGRSRFYPRVGKIPWRRQWQSTPALLPGKSHGRRSLIGYSPGGRKESDTTERLHFHFSVVKNPPANAEDTRDMSSIPGLGRSPGGGHGNPFQYSCLENPMDRGPWQAMAWSIVPQRLRHD